MNHSNNDRAPVYFTDERGRMCVRLRLARTTLSATLNAECFHRLIAAGISSSWFLNYDGSRKNSYVRVKVPGANTVTVANLIAATQWSQRVRYRNGDPLDLRLDNLRVTNGGHSHKDCLAMVVTDEAGQNMEA